MSGVVNFKFKSSTDYDAVPFDAASMSVADLKVCGCCRGCCVAYMPVGRSQRAIIERKKIDTSLNVDLRIAHAQTGDVYTEVRAASRTAHGTYRVAAARVRRTASTSRVTPR